MRRLFIALAALLMSPTLASAETITGTVSYLQRMMLPPDASVEILLQDVSRADAPAKTLVTYRIEAPGAPPYGFAIHYAPEQIDERLSYSLRASVKQGDKLLMTTDTAYPVLTRGAGTEVEMILRMVGGSEETKPDSDFVNTYWKLLTLNGEEVPVANNQREPHVILRSDGNYNATVGCNMILGGYEVSGAKVAFKPGPMTMMACIPPYDSFERDLVQALEAAASFGISGESMELLDPSGGTLATFRAVYF
ncbi:YbaY family lipoprotein [Aliiruegeria sabulilitoris]|uniref:YbaY family lipoprotein n=1 Tax=Aliiruegeria sabulilitoris TaxID=1510458 RepID=UPI00083048A9|nr:YbaY family lipoprotein [Aliiruegeria sabulilitoris]NDR58244.1 META domain-containing protein [Pseudoruegeria sp. M32A2M]